MSISFNNYLSSKIDSKFTSHFSFVDISATNKYTNYELQYGIICQPDDILSQARLFGNYAIASGMFENSIVSNESRVDASIQLLVDVYIYSYIKSVFYAYGIVTKQPDAMMGPQNNLVFYGHKLLHDIVVEGYIQQFLPNNSVVSVQVEIEPNVIKDLESFDIWNEVYDPSRRVIFNPRYESILNFILLKYPSKFEIGSISQNLDPSVKFLQQLPIGNACFSSDGLQFLFVECSGTQSDKKSFHWNKAVSICGTTIPFIDADDEIYDTVLSERLDSRTIGFDVEAITGFNPFGPMRSSQSRLNSSDDTNGGNNPPGPQKPKPKAPPGARSNDPQTKLSAVKDRITKYASNTVQTIMKLDQMLNSDNAVIIATFISDVTGQRIRAKSLKGLMGKSLSDVLERYGIKPNILSQGSPSEYDAFYAETIRQGNEYNVELVGTKKRLIAGPSPTP
jgi:hypothetical protein